MQLKRLYIKDYKILKDFAYEFPADFQRYINVIIGANGSGKSTILEAIAEIFSCTVMDEKSKFAFKLEYTIRHEEILSESSTWADSETTYLAVKIEAKEKEEKPMFEVHLPDGTILNSLSEINNNKDLKIIKPYLTSNLLKILPDSIVIYYSGLSDIMLSLCRPHNALLSENFRNGDSNLSGLFYYHEPVLFDLILISLLSYEYGDVPVYLREKAKIAGMQQIRIRLKKPHWAKSGDTVENFWGAKGRVQNFLSFLFSEMDNSDVVDMLITREFTGKDNVIFEPYGNERLDVIIIGQNMLFKIREYMVEERGLFNILHTIYLDDMLDGVDFSLYKEGNREMIPFGILSEGEQQAITIKGLIELLAQDNTLFLLDEPDTYMHPKWQKKFLSEIEEVIDQNSQREISFLIATHSPQILSNARPEKTFVKIIEAGRLIEQTPKHYGREISSILYNLMGVEERNETIKKDLSNLFTLLEEEEIEEAELSLQNLKDVLGETDPDIQNAIIQLGYLKEEVQGE